MCSAGDSALVDEVRLFSVELADGVRQSELSVSDIHCGGCIGTIERSLSALKGVCHVRVNLSLKRVQVRWRSETGPLPFIKSLQALGYPVVPLDQSMATAQAADRKVAHHLRALAVAGFAAGNIMLLSVSVWSGADPATQILFHWISALIAIPALLYSGRIFYLSAWHAIKHGRTNMDVPISVGILLTCMLGLYDTIKQGEQVYFEASVMLVFFLLIGRTLDYMVREKASTALDGLSRITPGGATLVGEDGTLEYVPIVQIKSGDLLVVESGQRVPVDGTVVTGVSEFDCSLVTGESAPQRVAVHSALLAGTLNLGGPVTVKATTVASASFLASVILLVANAESGKGRYQRLADRAARWYAPAVHSAAAISFLAWYWLSGDLHHSVTIAVAVLIITCPCAIGLAVPMVQVVASSRLFRLGVLMKDGAALERLADVDTVIFDKTGTLTQALPKLAVDANPEINPAYLALAQSMARHSTHPYSRALCAANAISTDELNAQDITNYPGQGIEARVGQDVFRLGHARWALDASSAMDRSAMHNQDSDLPCTILSRNQVFLTRFQFEETLRPDTRECVDTLCRQNIHVELLSGDEHHPVRQAAVRAGIRSSSARMSPARKTQHVQCLSATGQSVLMVGDGLNDSGALAAAHVSMAPGSAAELGRTTADFVFLRDSLRAVSDTVAIARQASSLVRQNFLIAVLYNLVALPFAVLGYVTPLVAALAMSASSILVVLNALRLRAPIVAKTDQHSAQSGSGNAGSRPAGIVT